MNPSRTREAVQRTISVDLEALLDVYAGGSHFLAPRKEDRGSEVDVVVVE